MRTHVFRLVLASVLSGELKVVNLTAQIFVNPDKHEFDHKRFSHCEQIFFFKRFSRVSAHKDLTSCEYIDVFRRDQVGGAQGLELW